MNRKHYGGALVAAAVLLGAWLGLSAPVNAQEATRFTLANGLRVVVQVDHRLPLVNVTVMYGVGSVNEAPGITGIAHYVEHMAFRETAHISQTDLTGTIERIGGRWNGYTSLDQTLYGATVPSWALESVLRIEAERMAQVVFDPVAFERERTSIISELQGYENDPASILWDLAVATSFEIHPYLYNIIGWLSDVESIQCQRAEQFYRDYYGPNHAVLTVAGDVDPQQLRALVEKYFGALAPAPRSTEIKTVEPPQRGEKRVTLIYPGSQQHLTLLYRAPAATDPGFPVLLVLDALLAGGRGLLSLPGGQGATPSSRLQQAVEAAGGARADTSLTPTRMPYVYGISASAGPDASPEKLEDGITADLDRLAKEGVSAEELQRARRRLRAANAFESSRLADIAHRLAYFENLGSWELAQKTLSAIERVTSEDIQHYLRKWMQPRRRTVARHLLGKLPAEAPAAVRAAELPPAEPAAPSPVPQRALQVVPLPSVDALREKLENGLTLAVARTAGATGALQIRLGFGGALDPPGREGLALLAARLLTRDPGLHAALEGLGAQLSNSAVESPTEFERREYIELSTRFLAGDWRDMISRLAQALARPPVSPKEFERERTELLEEIAALNDDPLWVAQEAALRRAEPGWHPPLGTPESVGRLTVGEVNQFLREHLRGGNLWVGLVAPEEPAALMDAAKPAFAALPAGQPMMSPQAEEAPPQAGEERVRMPGKTQAEIVAALPGVARGDADALPLLLLNYILGETGYAGRLGAALVDTGLTYSVYAVPHFGRGAGPITIETGAAANRVDETLAALRGVLADLQQKGVEDGEVREAKAFRLGRLAFQLETETALAQALVESAYYGEDRLDFAARSREILAVTRKQLNDAARRYYAPEKFGLGVAGAIRKASGEQGKEQEH